MVIEEVLDGGLQVVVAVVVLVKLVNQIQVMDIIGISTHTEEVMV